MSKRWEKRFVDAVASGWITQEQADEAQLSLAEIQRPSPTWFSGAIRRARMLKLVTEGMLIKQSLETVGWHHNTYEYHRRTYPQWAYQIDAARGAIGGVGAKTRFLPGNATKIGFAEFRNIYFGFKSPWFHLKIIEALEKGEPGSITLVLVAPFHGKTTVIEDFCNYKLALDPHFRITVGSEGQNHARKILSRVRGRMEKGGSAEFYEKNFGPFAPQSGEDKTDDRKARQPWGADAFDVYKRGTFDERDRNMIGLGWRANVAGTRTDLLIVDDIQSLKSLGQTEDMFTTFRQDWLSRPGAEAPTVVIGTRVGPQDFYSRLMDEDMVDHLIVIPAIDHDGRYLWPERYSPEQYDRMKRNVGEDAWWRNYMQQPRYAGDVTFRNDSIRKCQRPMRQIGEMPEKGEMVLSLDPALSGGNALMAAQWNRTLDVVDLLQDTGLSRTEQILDRIQDFAIRYKPTTVIIEMNAFQRGLVRDDRLMTMASNYGFRVLEHATQGNKRDEVFGVASMAQDLDRELITFPMGGDLAHARMEPLFEEMMAWRPNQPTRRTRQDRLMALWFQWLRWRQRNVNIHATGKPIQMQPSPMKTSTGGRVFAGSGRVW